MIALACLGTRTGEPDMARRARTTTNSFPQQASRALRRLARPRGERLIVFTRYPEPGRAKTRLISVLGREGAAELQRRMTEHTMRAIGALMGRRPLALEVRFDGGRVAGSPVGEGLMRKWLGAGVRYRHQGAGDLGERMARAFDETFEERTERAVIVGCDCPGITADLLERAFDALRGNELVLGPAGDGGYYLIGLRRRQPRLFAGIPWGTGAVLERTLAAARGLGLSVRLLDVLDDVDRPDDLPVWRRFAAPAVELAAMPRISVIVPTLNESANLGLALASTARGWSVEVIVVDGGSDDGTADVARLCGARVMSAARGRARQMNAGAATASGDVLLFFHADTQLPWGFDECVRHALARPGVVAGAFEFAIDGDGAALRVVERLTNFRARRLQMPYGDQAIFLRAETFRAVGGFPEIPIMEDYELVARLRRRGKVEVVHAPAVTSARRWERVGVFRTTLLNQVMIGGYWLGVSPERLAGWYRARKDEV